MDNDELILELVAESREHLSEIEPDMLELESRGNDVPDELLNRIFRAVHSIKGGFGFYGKTTIVELSHAMENVLSRVRDREITVDSALTDVLLQGLDKLRVMLDDIDASDRVSIDREVAALKPFLKEAGRKGARKKRSTRRGASPKTNEGTSGEGGISTEDSEGEKADATGDEAGGDDQIGQVRRKHPEFSEEHIYEAVRNGRQLYQVTVTPASECTGADRTFNEVFAAWEKFGPIVCCNPARESLEEASGDEKVLKGELSVVLASVLEPDLIAEALGVDEERILTLDIGAYKEKMKEEQEKKRLQSSSARKPDDPSATQSGSASGAGRKSPAAIEEAIRVKTGLLNNLMNYAGELVLARNQLMQAVQQSLAFSDRAETVKRAAVDAVKEIYDKHCSETKSGEVAIPNVYLETIEAAIEKALGFAVNDIDGMKAISQNIDMVTSVLQENIMQTRMQPVSVVFSKFPRVIRDLARKLNKKIVLEQHGQDVEVDKTLIELLSDPLTHLVRNSADHGIEPPEERTRNGKPEEGRVVLEALQEGGKVFIRIFDDGEGIDVERVKKKAVESGLIDEEKAAAISDKDAQMLIFTPGFSSAKTVSEVSGRGVGMDVVKSNIEKLGGSIEVSSRKGEGTTITLAMPLTLAIIPSLIVSAAGRRFAIPQVALEEVVRIRGAEVTRTIERINNAEVLRLRGTLLPLVRLVTVLGIAPTYRDRETGEEKPDRRARWSDRRGVPREEAVEKEAVERREGTADRRENTGNAVKIVILSLDENRFGLVVDDVQDSEEIVVKPLSVYLQKSACFAGATIMGDGRVAMILDPAGIASMADLRFKEIADAAARRRETRRASGGRGGEATMLLFTIGGEEHFAVDLSHIARIEKRARSEIEKVGSKEFVKYDDGSLELFRFENFMPVQGPAEQSDSFFVLVPKNTGRRFGLVAERVEDTVQTQPTIETDAVSGPGILGSTIVNDTMTLVVDMTGVLQTVES